MTTLKRLTRPRLGLKLETNADKLAWLHRQFAELNLPDIYGLYQEGFIPNGCGPDTWVGRLVPNRFLFLPPLTVAGDLHDYLYWLGGLEADRARADNTFRLCIQRLGADIPVRWWSPPSWVAQRRLNVIADLYYDAVHWFGHGHFSYHGNTPMMQQTMAVRLVGGLVS